MNWLTAYIERALEGFSYLRIKFNDQVVLGSNSAVAIFDDLRDPFPEIVTDDCVNDIYNPLSWKPTNIALVRHMGAYLLESHSLRQDILNWETLIKWNMQMFGFIRFDNYIDVRNIKWKLTAFGTSYQVFEEIDGQTFWRR